MHGLPKSQKLIDAEKQLKLEEKQRVNAAEVDREDAEDGARSARKKARMEAEERKNAEDKIKKAPTTRTEMGKGFKKGGSVKSSASKRADGCATKGKTRGKMV